MLSLGDRYIFFQIDFLVLVLIGVVGTRKRRYIETIFVLFGVLLHYMTFGVATHDSFFGQLDPRQSTSLFVPAWAGGFERDTLVFLMLGALAQIRNLESLRNFGREDYKCSGPSAVEILTLLGNGLLGCSGIEELCPLSQHTS